MILERIKQYIDLKGISVSAFERSIGMSNASFGKSLKNGGAIGSDKLENILKVYPDISPSWLMTGDGDMLIENEPVYTSPSKCLENFDEETLPRIPLDAAAGSLSTIAQSVTQTQCERFPIIHRFPKYDFTIIVKGDSMEPEFRSGDEIACRFIDEPSFIQWGRPHILDTNQGVVLKRIYNRSDAILCRSDNSAYEDFEIPKGDIFHIALVVGAIRVF